MNFEFGSSGFSSGLEGFTQSLEQFNDAFANLEGIQNSLFQKNAETMQFSQLYSDLTSKIGTASQNEFFNAQYKETPTFNALKKLNEKCLKAKTSQELKSISAEYEKLMKTTAAPKVEAAIKQQGINAGVGIKKAVDMSAPLELHADEALKKVGSEVDDAARIAAEAVKRTKSEEAAKKTAEQAQKFYASLSDSTTGKSAKESAEIIKQSLDKADEAAKAIAEAKNNAVNMPAAKLALPPKQELLALPPHNTADKADDVIKAAADTLKTSKHDAAQTFTNTLKNTGDDIISLSNTEKSKSFIEKTKDFVKEKAIPFTKTKQFKIAAAGTAALVLTLGIIKYNKNKQEKQQQIDVVK